MALVSRSLEDSIGVEFRFAGVLPRLSARMDSQFTTQHAGRCAARSQADTRSLEDNSFGRSFGWLGLGIGFYSFASQNKDSTPRSIENMGPARQAIGH